MNDDVLRQGDLIAGLEAGGTKCIVAIARLGENIVPEILDRVTIKTSAPKETLEQICQSFSGMASSYGPIKALGIGSFGPLILDPKNPNFGALDSTPKPDWTGVNLLESLNGVAPIVRLDTDVNAAALAEYYAVTHQGVTRLAYVTVGTGLGVGIVNNGKPYGGKRHLEMGHISVQRHAQDFDYAGHCPFHSDCLEGLVCGPSIIDRFGNNLSELAPDHVAHEIISYYLAQLVVAISYSHAPDRIIFGGGVMQVGDLIPRVRNISAKRLGNYPSSAPFMANMDDYISSPKLGVDSGLLGSMLLALTAAN